MNELLKKLEADLAETEKAGREVWEGLNQNPEFLEWRRLTMKESDLRSAVNGLKSAMKVSEAA